MAPPSVAARVLVTLVAPLVVLLASRVPLPGVEIAALERHAHVSVGALGILPLVSAAALVEIAALVVPAWRSLRENEAGRLKLVRAAIAVSLALALAEAYRVMVFIEAIDPLLGMKSRLMVVLSLIAGYALLLTTAALVSARGAINGVIAVGLSGWMIEGWSAHLGLPQGAPSSAAEPIHRLLLNGAAVAAVALAAAWAGRAGSCAATPAAGGPYRARQPGPRAAIPGPAAGVIAAAFAMSAATLPATLANLGLPFPRWLHGPWLPLLAGVLASVLFARLFHPRQRLQRVFGEGDAPLLAETAASVAFTLLLIAVALLAAERGLAIDALWAALFGAACVDGVRYLRMPADMQRIGVYHRAYEAEAARARLEAAGIAAHLKDQRTRVLLQFFGPYVPIALYAADAPRARDVLAEPAPLQRARAPWATKVLPCAVALLAFAAVDRGLLAAFARPEPVREPVTLELLHVDDQSPWLDHLDEEPPESVKLEPESVPLGPGRTEGRHFAVVTGERIPDEAASWLRERITPEHRLAWGRRYTYDEGTGRDIATGWRSFLLRGEAWLTSRHVADAQAMVDEVDGVHWYVDVELTPEGGRLFERATEQLVNRRLAILIDGRVEVAPVVREPIRGGRLRIVMGARTEAQREEAERLAAGLRAAATR